jgi:integrase/recombinase XerD
MRDRFVRSRAPETGRRGTTDVSAYLRDLEKSGFAPTSQARRLSALRQYFRFLYAENLRADDPTGTIESPKKARPLPKVLSVDDVDRLLERAAAEAVDLSVHQKELAGAVRTRALLELLYATGLRVSELVSLPVNIGWRDEPFFMVKGKGDKERMVPVTQSARNALDAHLELRDRDPRAADCPWLFPAENHEAHLARQVFARDLKALGARCGIDAATAVAACSAPCLRQPPPAERRRSARRATVARPCRHFDDADLTHVLEERLHKLVNEHHPLAQ